MRGKRRVKKRNIPETELLFSNQQLKKLIFPLVIEQLLTVMVGMADSLMVASVGEAAVSGVSLVDTVMVLLINILQHWRPEVRLRQDIISVRRMKKKQARQLISWFCSYWCHPLSLWDVFICVRT